MEVVKAVGQVGDVFGAFQCVISLCTAIYTMAQNAKANKDRCQRVAKRVKALHELVLTIKQRGPGQISVNVENALKELHGTLAAAQQLVMKFSRTKAVMSFIKGSTLEEKFNEINERLSDNFQVLSGALQVQHGDVLHKVYETLSGRKQEEEYCSGQASCISPTSPTPPMPIYSPTTPMPVPQAFAPMPVSMPPPAAFAPMPVSMPVPQAFAPMPVSMPVPQAFAPMPVSMPVPQAFAPMPVSTTIVSRPVFAPLSPTVISSTMAFKPVIRTFAPVRAPVAVVRSYVVNNSYFP